MTGDDEFSREAVIARIRTALQRRSGKQWSVGGGAGTAYGYIQIDVPPARRRFNEAGTGPAEEGTGYSSTEERTELARLLGLK